MPDTMPDAAPLPAPEDLRAEVRAWLRRNWTGAAPDCREHGLGGAGPGCQVLDALAVPTWPADWFGRAYPSELAAVIEREFAAAGAPGAGQDKHNIAANTILRYGSEKLRGDLIRDALTGRGRFCLFYSEPGAGSDLAGVRTTAVRDGDHWVVNGQKVWTSGAASADFALMIARTDWDAPKHRGLSYFVVPMRQPGIEVRPLRQITGESQFNEVFITDAVVPGDYLVGEPGNGWRVLQTALAYERSIMGDGARASRNGTLADDLIGLARMHGRLMTPSCATSWPPRRRCGN